MGCLLTFVDRKSDSTAYVFCWENGKLNCVAMLYSGIRLEKICFFQRLALTWYDVCAVIFFYIKLNINKEM